MKETRPYVMAARARATEETRERLLGATVELVLDRPLDEVSLDAIAAQAGVTVQTLLRHFKSRAGLLDAAFVWGAAHLREERLAPTGDVEAAVRVLVGHYEARGDRVLLHLAQETREPISKRLTDAGRREHRAWVAEVFAPMLAEERDAEALTDLLVVATDVYTWKILRRDRGLSRRCTEERMVRLVRALLPDPGRARAGRRPQKETT